MRKHLLGVTLCLALLGAALSVAQGAPSFRGYTGLVVIPTADTLNSGEYNFGLMTEDTGEFDANDLFANYGAANGLEIGLNSNQASPRETLISAKYLLMRETEERAGVAFGIFDLTDERQSTAYVIVSKSLVRGLNLFDSEITNLRGHIRLGGGTLDGLFGGVSGFVGNRMMFSVEWDSRDTNLGFRFTPFRTVRLHAALFDLGGSSDLGLGISFNKSY